MAKNIIILGAGASAQYGAPVMSNFLERALDLRSQGLFSKDSESALDKIESVLAELQRASHKSNIDLENIESILTTLEMAQIFEKLPGFNPREIPEIINGFRLVISETLLQSIGDPKPSKRANPALDNSSPELPEELTKLVYAIVRRNKAINGNDTVIISFNYDLIIDTAIAFAPRVAGIVNYGFEREWFEDSVLLLKLHGSLNWFNSGTDLFHVGWRDIPGIDRIRKLSAIKNAYEQVANNARERLAKIGADESGIVPWIVPPSWNKFSGYQKIQPVWALAAKELSDAQHIHIIGYSLPESDGFFRSLFSIGTIGKSQLRSVTYYDPASTAVSRFKNLLSARGSNGFSHKPQPADKAFAHISTSLGIQNENE